MNSVRVQKVGQSLEGSKIVQKVVHMIYQEQAQKYINIIENIQGSHDINKIHESTMILDQSKIKGIYLDKSQKKYSLFIKYL